MKCIGMTTGYVVKCEDPAKYSSRPGPQEEPRGINVHTKGAPDLHDAVQGVEGEAGKWAERVLLVVLVVYVVQRPAGRQPGSSCYSPDACTQRCARPCIPYIRSCLGNLTQQCAMGRMVSWYVHVTGSAARVQLATQQGDLAHSSDKSVIHHGVEQLVKLLPVQPHMMERAVHGIDTRLHRRHERRKIQDMPPQPHVSHPAAGMSTQRSRLVISRQATTLCS
jgi:hypothetical protein